MTTEQILDLFEDVTAILGSLQSELSCITTSDTGHDPTAHIRADVELVKRRIKSLLKTRQGVPS